MIENVKQTKGVKILNNGVNVCHSIETSGTHPVLESNLFVANSKIVQNTSEKVENSQVDVVFQPCDSSVKVHENTMGGVSDSFMLLYDVNFVGI